MKELICFLKKVCVCVPLSTRLPLVFLKKIYRISNNT